MRKVKLSIVAVTLILFSALGYAGKNFVPAKSKPIPVFNVPLGLYLGGGLTYADSECECPPLLGADGTIVNKSESKTYGFNLKAGYNLNKYMSFEAKYLYTPWGDEDKTLKHYGIYFRPIYPITDNIDIYGLIGYGKTECETMTDTYKGVSWGLGTSYNFNKRVQDKKDGLGVYVEYIRPLKKTGNKNIQIDTVQGGVEYNW